MEQVILGIDIGSSKICSLIAEVKNGVPNIIGMGVKSTKGVRKGAIISIEHASRSIKESVSDARRIAGTNISNAIISLSGVYTKSINSTGVINNPHSDIGIQEINRVMQTALYNANIPNNYEVIHVLPYLFKIDDREYIEDPFGMSGSRLEVAVHIVTAQKSGLENLKKAVKNAGINVDGVVLSAYASSIAVLTNDERDLNAACIDMGANSCNIMIHQGNSMKYDDFLGVGSGHITNDITLALGTPQQAAEDIKINYATLYDLTQDELDYKLEIPARGDGETTRSVPLELLHNIVLARVDETLRILAKSLVSSGLSQSLGAGVMITGGMAKMKGLGNLIVQNEMFGGLPVRIASPREVNGSFKELQDPAYATVVGLILYGAGQYTNYELDSNKKLKYNQSKTQQSSALNNLNVKENDLSDLATMKEQPEQKEIIKNDIKLDKGKKGMGEKFVKWCKELF